MELKIHLDEPVEESLIGQVELIEFQLTKMKNELKELAARILQLQNERDQWRAAYHKVQGDI